MLMDGGLVFKMVLRSIFGREAVAQRHSGWSKISPRLILASGLSVYPDKLWKLA